MKDEWESGQTLNLASTPQLCLNAAQVGKCQGLAFVQELTFDQLQGELDATEQ